MHRHRHRHRHRHMYTESSCSSSCSCSSVLPPKWALLCLEWDTRSERERERERESSFSPQDPTKTGRIDVVPPFRRKAHFECVVGQVWFVTNPAAVPFFSLAHSSSSLARRSVGRSVVGRLSAFCSFGRRSSNERTKLGVLIIALSFFPAADAHWPRPRRPTTKELTAKVTTPPHFHSSFSSHVFTLIDPRRKCTFSEPLHH